MIKNELISKNSINSLANREIKSNLNTMLLAMENGKKATWQYAIAVAKIIGSEQYKEDFHDLKSFADYVCSSKATLSQYNNAVAFMTRENFIPSRETTKGRKVIDYDGILFTVFNAYLLSTLSEEEFSDFEKYCDDNDIIIFQLSQNKLKEAIKAWKATKQEATKQETTEEITEETTEETTEEQETTIQIDTKEKAVVAIIGLMKKFNITLEEIAEQEEQ